MGLKLAALVLTVIGVGFSILGIVKYSDFLTRLHVVDPGNVEGLSLETTENWSRKNWAIGAYFWRKKYLGNDPELNDLGNAVRRLNITAIALVVTAACFVLLSGIVA